MTILTVSDLTRYFGAERIFDAVNFQLGRGEKVALVGTNGSGKSTLLKIIAGLQQSDHGSVSLARGTRIAYLAQEVRFEADRTLWQEMVAAFDYLTSLQAEMETLEGRMADTSAPDWERLMERYAELTERFEHGGGYQMEQRIEQTLQGLGFAEEQYQQPLSRFSGGQKTRAGLAAALLSDPDLLLLDEPTNHLDLASLEWLERFLTAWDGTLLVTSHDRYFLDKVTRRTLEMAFGTLEDYPAGYSRYLELKAERMERRLKEYEEQQEFIARTEEFIRRYSAGQRSKEAKGREKRLNRFKQQQIARPHETAKLKLFLDSQLRSGELVLALNHLATGYGQTILVKTGERELHRGERVALLGPNGSGKTTLLRTLLHEIPAITGNFQPGHNVTIAYYAQGHEGLDMDATVIQEILRAGRNLGEPQARNLLGRFLFSGDDVFKRVGSLSGGERSRVALAKLTLQPGNLLIMDEPTNHLDIQAREALEAVLKEYPGSLLFVSHDRSFIDALADKLWIIRNGQLVEHLGNYSDYMALQEQEQKAQSKPAKANERSTPASGAANANPAAAEHQRKKRLAALEAELEKLEQQLAGLKQELEAASSAQDIAAITTLGTRYTELEALIQSRYSDWEQLAA
jgi:ATP-binding cassette subfamily F protein 3